MYALLKKSFLLILLTMSIAGLNAQTLKITDPVKYNDYIVGQQNIIGTELLKLIGMFDALPEDKSETFAQLDVVITKCSEGVANLKNLKPIANEFGMRQAAIELFSFYHEIMDTDYRTIIDQLYSDAPDMEIMQGILTKVQDAEAVVDAKFQSAQKAFSAHHNIQLEENELQEEFDETEEGQ
jgi:hypothetical protein